MPTCAQGSSFPVVGFCVMALFGLFGFFLVPCANGRYQLGLFTPLCVQGLGHRGVTLAGHALWAEVGVGIVFVTSGEIVGHHTKLPDIFIREEVIPSMEAV